MAQTKLESYRSREAVERNALHGGSMPPDYSAAATRARAMFGGDGRRPTWLLEDDAERRRVIREGDHGEVT